MWVELLLRLDDKEEEEGVSKMFEVEGRRTSPSSPLSVGSDLTTVAKCTLNKTTGPGCSVVQKQQCV